MTAAMQHITIPMTSSLPSSIPTSSVASATPSAPLGVNRYIEPCFASDQDEVEIWRRTDVIKQLMWFRSHCVGGSAARTKVSPSGSEVDSTLAEIVEVAGGVNSDLREALRDLDAAEREALEDGFPVPSKIALENARRLLRALYQISRRRYEVYPTPDGEVAIDAPGAPRCSVLLLCDTDGGALCLVNVNGKHRRAHYSDSSPLPDGFVREALAELRAQDDLAA